jgi:hypothetical protein
MQNLGQFFRENRKFLVRISFTSLVCFLMGLYGVYVNPSFFAQNRSYFLMPYITWSIPFVWSFLLSMVSYFLEKISDSAKEE